MERNGFFDRRHSDEEVLDFVRNIYAVLLTHMIKGTYAFVVGGIFRERLRPAFGSPEV